MVISYFKKYAEKFGRVNCNVIFALPKQKRVDSVAQLVEQYTFNVWALGSSPSGITKIKKPLKAVFLFYIF